MAEIITIGEILVEVMAKNIGQTFSQTGEFVGPFPSGAPAIFIDQAAQCGSDTMIIAAVGNDGFGHLNINRLNASGVNTSKIKILDDVPTGVAFVTYKEDGDRDFIFHISNAASGRINGELVDVSDFTDCHYFHIMGSSIFNEGSLEAIQKGIQLAKTNDTKITFDPNVRKEIVTDRNKKDILINILYQSHIILAGENELYYLTDIEDEKESVHFLMNKGAEMIIIKRGKRGSTLYTKDQTVHVGAFKVEEIDPTGAGDCFGGTFISCLNQGISPVTAIKLATIAGAMAVTKKGPMQGNTNLKELQTLLK